MLQRYDIEADCTVEPMNGSMYPKNDGEYVLYEDIKELIRLVGNLVGKNGWRVEALIEDSSPEELKETLYTLEKEIKKIEK